jgi:hypothetical protein
LLVEFGDLRAVLAEQPEPQRGRRIEPAPAGHIGERREPWAYRFAVGRV